jgi:hypothetical protein
MDIVCYAGISQPRPSNTPKIPSAIIYIPVWMRTPRTLHTESLYTLAAPGPVRKASVMGPRRVVTRRPRTDRLHRKLFKAGRDEDLGPE